MASFYFNRAGLYNSLRRDLRLNDSLQSDRLAAMQTQRFCQIFLAGILVGLLGACAHYPRRGSGALAGTWKNSVGTVWILREDGTFEVDLDRDGKRDSWGKYKVKEDTVTLSRVGGYAPKRCRGKGIYRFARSAEDSLQFTLVQDECKLRVRNVILGWKRE